MDSLYAQREKKLIIFALIVLALYVSPLFILGENAHIRVHDNLDSNLAWYKVLRESGQIFGPINAVIPQVMNGIPRNAYGTEYSGIVWLYALFPTMTAYALSQTITRLAAFLGMYLLLRDHFLKEKEWGIITIGTSLAFALTPFWPSGMLSTLGMPLALWAFLHIRKGRKSWKDYLVLTLLPFYSSIVLGFFFFLFAMGVLWIIDVIRRKRYNLALLLSLIYMSIVYCFVEYRLVYSFLFSTEPNSRDEYIHARLSLWRAIRLTFKNYVLGHTHVMTVHGLIILPILLLGFYLVWKKGWWRQEKYFVFLFILNFILSLWYAFWFYKGWQPLTEKFHFMNTFNFARFHFLRPLVIYMSFALALKIIWQNKKELRSVIYFSLAAQLFILGLFNEEIFYRSKPSVKEFYAEELFSQIKNHIGLPVEEYRVASIGLHPAIAQYNGFYTLDTYNNFYPLSYKHEFRKIIEKELNKNKQIRIYFDEWGGRCYLFTDELGKHYMFKKNTKKKLEHVQFNFEPFKKMGGTHIFSSVPIKNAEQNQLQLEKVFSNKESVWKIYLYKVV
ncbi:DUF6044 family protein [Niallia endozanthoxylica]|uniref:YkoS n=1 Tax=Niallia endozanthoxylica TaxID=2036016 RepID=A0A5J5HJM3_9BACI|nr:DUF6044 family protein [Niallia endozanthoxylica]KAA9019933.1 hypothetical protein F4V44_18700 [Niallia endozanthoxylica]